MTYVQIGVCLASAVAVIAAISALRLARSKGITNWLAYYLRWRWSKPSKQAHTHVIFCFVDHYEPRWGGRRDMPKESARVARWVADYPPMARAYKDADGQHPKHTFFFPEEEYESEHLDALQTLCESGFGELEIHLHHDNDTSENLRKTLVDFARVLHDDHGAMSLDRDSGELRYAFIHGNWVLDNSDPSGRWCGVNDELNILRDTGCYADFTFPCAPHPAQPSQVNAIYYATDDPEQPKSHDTGRAVKVGGNAGEDLMLITGPLRFNWRRRKGGLLPRIENADIRSSNPPTKDRIDYWVDTGIQVSGRPEWVFVKVHTHGAPEREADTLLGAPIKAMHQHLGTAYNDGKRYSLHYTTAREMYNIAKAAEAGYEGNPNDYRDFLLPPPANVPSAQATGKVPA